VLNLGPLPPIRGILNWENVVCPYFINVPVFQAGNVGIQLDTNQQRWCSSPAGSCLVTEIVWNQTVGKVLLGEFFELRGASQTHARTTTCSLQPKLPTFLHS
jgi:hypothetical protein